MNTTFDKLKPGDYFHLRYCGGDVYLVTERSGSEVGPNAVVRVHSPRATSTRSAGVGNSWERHFTPTSPVIKLTQQTPPVFVAYQPPMCKCCGQTMPEVGEN